MMLNNFVFYWMRVGSKPVTWKNRKETCKSIYHVIIDDTVKSCSDNKH